jgi:hypothetical protein
VEEDSEYIPTNLSDYVSESSALSLRDTLYGDCRFNLMDSKICDIFQNFIRTEEFNQLKLFQDQAR